MGKGKGIGLAGLALGALLTAGILLRWQLGSEQGRLAAGQIRTQPQVVWDPGHGGMDGAWSRKRFEQRPYDPI